MIPRLISAVIPLALLAACVGRAPEGGVPLPKAYPRIAVYDSVYTPVDSLPLVWERNSSAPAGVRHSAAGDFADIVYPAYTATLHLTFTPLASGKQRIKALDNRLERMGLNTGGADSELTEFFTPAGFAVKLLVTPSGSPVPVQFLAIAQDWLVSGTLALSKAPESADSVAPVIRTVRRDIVHALMQMR